MAKRVISAILTLKDKDFSTGLRGAAKNVNDFDRRVQHTKNQINDFGQQSLTTFKNIGAAAAGLGATAVTAFGAALVSTISEMDSAFSMLEAKTGATGTQLARLENVAKDVFTAGFGESIAMVADDVAMLNAMFGELSDTQLTEVAKGVSTISEMWGADAKEIGRAIQGLTKNFDGLSESKALDLITYTFQKTGDYSDDLLDTFNEYAVHFSKLGLSAEEFAGILANSTDAFNLDKVGDAVKEFGILAIDGSESTAEGFAAIGFSADEMASKIAAGGDTAHNTFMATIAGLASIEDPVKRNAAGVQLFGTMWEDLRDDVILSMADGAKAVEGFEGATSRAAEAMHDNFGAKMQNVWRELKVGMADAFNNAGGQELLDGLASKAQEFIPVIEDMATGAVNFGTAVRDNWPAIKEAMVSVGTFIGILGAVKLGIAGVAAAQAAWNVVMTANPIGLIIVGISALIAIGVLLYRNWDVAKEKAVQLWGILRGNPITAFLTQPIQNAIDAGVWLYKNWDTIKASAVALWSVIKEKFASIKGAISNAIQPIIGWFSTLNDKWNAFKGAISNFKLPDWARNLGGGAVGWVMDKVQGSFAVGTNSVPHDMVAQIHKGEMIIPARQAQNLRQQGVTIDNVDRAVPNVTTTNNNSRTANNINININAQGMTTAQVIDELVPQLELVLSNM